MLFFEHQITIFIWLIKINAFSKFIEAILVPGKCWKGGKFGVVGCSLNKMTYTIHL